MKLGKRLTSDLCQKFPRQNYLTQNSTYISQLNYNSVMKLFGYILKLQIVHLIPLKTINIVSYNKFSKPRPGRCSDLTDIDRVYECKPKPVCQHRQNTLQETDLLKFITQHFTTTSSSMQLCSEIIYNSTQQLITDAGAKHL